MEHDRESGQTAADFLKDVKAELGLRAGFELVCAVAGADGDRKAVASGAGDELLDVLGTGVGAVFGGDVDFVFDSCEGAELGLYDHAVVMGIFHYLFCERDVVLEGFGGRVDHYGGESVVDAGFAELK